MTGDEFWTYDATDGSSKTRSSDAAIFCACELAPSGTNSNQAQSDGHKGYVCEFVRSIADDTHDHPAQRAMPRSSVSDTGQTISVILNVDNIRRRLQSAMKETRTAEKTGHR